MSDISGISVSMADKNLATKETAATMKDDFMQLLVAQLQHQDPMSPMKAMDFTSQLSQFAALEQMFYMNDNLESLQRAQASINNIQAVSFIGKIVKTKGDIVDLDDGKAEPLSYRLDEKASSVGVRVMDENGKVIRSYEVGEKEKGVHTLQWDGRDRNGSISPDGNYRFEISATGIDGEDVKVSTYIEGRITGLTFEDSLPLLHIGSIKVPIGDVYEILEEKVEEEEEEEEEAAAATPETPPQSASDPDSSPQL